MQVLLVETSGTVTPLGTKELTLEQLYEAIGCDMVELVRFPWGDMWADEEGLLKEPRIINIPATRLMQDAYGPATGIVGNVVLYVRKNREYVASRLFGG